MNAPPTRTYSGWLSLRDYGEAWDILFLSGVDVPLADALDWMAGKTVTVRYWITDAAVSRDAAQLEALRAVFGAAHVLFASHYSEITGYLWTDQELSVGGHDLLAELSSGVGKYLILEIEEHGPRGL